MRRSPLNYERKQTKVKMLKNDAACSNKFLPSGAQIMLWRVVRFDLTNVIFAACFTLTGHDTHIDFLGVLFLVGRIGPLIQT